MFFSVTKVNHMDNANVEANNYCLSIYFIHSLLQ